MQPVLFWSSFFLVILSRCLFLNGAPSQCPDSNLNITGGTYTLSKGYNHNSVLRYHCSEGFYPSIKQRRCERGQWEPKVSKRLPVCKLVTCPNPNVLENGVVRPFSRNYSVNDTTTYTCHSEFTFRGSATRVCQTNGKWSGGTPICSQNNHHCPDPGIPPGASREGHIFDIDDKVTYTCDKNLKLIGSKVRVCLDGGYWSGKEPECYADFTYDTPEEVAEAFSSSLKTTITMHEESDQTGKKIRLDQKGNLDIYIALDASDSIDEEDFTQAKGVIKKLLNKISYYEVFPNYEIIIFATDVKHIIRITEFKKNHVTIAQIIKMLDEYTYDSDDRKRTGTDIHKAYEAIKNSISFEKINNKKEFAQTQHVVIMFTDGIANMGGDPKPIVNEIRQIVQDGDKNREKYLDLYAFGVGSDVEKEKIDEWVTKRYNNEKYFFMLKDIEQLEETLDEMIDESTSMPLCGLYKDYDPDKLSPWLIKISINHKNSGRSNCVGSLVTPMFILTAAHCFKFDDDPETIELEAPNSKDKSLLKADKYELHPGYNISKKKAQHIEEFYEYDVALIKLKKMVKISPDLRTICIPCTLETNRALQLSDKDASCEKQKQGLVNSDLVKAHFIKHDQVKKGKQHVSIKRGQQKFSCVEQAKKTLNISDETAQAMITDKFFCTGGASQDYRDVITCKGDSGGPIVVEMHRLIQVGVISWGLIDVYASTLYIKTTGNPLTPLS
ncbi:hypothetical protein KOW79_015789 [Hemibagrus wyckioides]|uniref:C3/C5 convertase n=1 Tax=Hemibagrus wyckioides TaxID=337641 RepID=A0A9D3NGT8_9TELE|nr:hypothetical protein KOW79_015789 [Hemibagrus wyckioides]